MESLFLSLIGIMGLFFLFFAIRNIFNSKKICTICLSVSLTWIFLLSLYFLKIFPDKTIIAVLMGQTSIGLFYLFYEKLNVFKLPFLLTLTSVIYFIFEGIKLNAMFLLAGIWVSFSLIYLFKSNKKINVFANKLVECCRKW